MADRVYQSRESVQHTGDGIVRDRVVANESPARPYAMAERIVMLITGFVLSLPFASLIYGLTAPLVAPFFGLFGYTMQYGVVRLEIETLVAMLVYLLIGYGISRLMSVGRLR
ncbi:MAG: hypothetical protein K0S68_469 [Candidatus Saccharibacteria bacterium]|nr:hypothetical protein [Candidatus Saccharibacteria bacterium]